MRAALLLLVMAVQDDKAKEQERLLKAPFEAMEKGIRENDEKLFKAQWHADAYTKNLVGGSGIAGEGVFKQGARKKWFPKPDLTKAQDLGDGAAFIVPCEIWNWEKEKSVDKVDMLLVKTEVTVDEKKTTVLVVLGGGEKAEEVKALAERWQKKEPLEPPKK